MTNQQKYLSQVIVLAIALTVPTHAQEVQRRDGNWWRTIITATKQAYTIGIWDGLPLGERFSYWNIRGKDGKQDNAVAVRVIQSFEEHEKLLSGITNGQVTDGLDSFYGDYRNRRILVFNAVWVVLNTISGKSEKEMETMIENFRKNAVE
jgi:hypothetical protein